MEGIDLESELIHLTLRLYSNPVIPRNVIQLFVTMLICFVTNIVLPFTERYLVQTFPHLASDITSAMRNLKDRINSVLRNFDTEHKRFSLYKRKGLYSEPEVYNMGIRTNTLINSDGSKRVETEAACGIYMSLKKSLKLLLEIPGSLKLVKDYIQTLKNDKEIISNFIQADLWKGKYDTIGDRLELPLTPYHDDCEIGNALGSHAGVNKIGTIYVTIPCFPPSVSSHLNSIIVAGLFYSSDKKICSNKNIFSNLIAELNDLKRNGLQIQVDGKIETVYFQLALILGDNLGLAETLGYTESFTTGRGCRMCVATVQDMKKMTVERVDLLRTRENYDEYCEKPNLKDSGIKERCVFNSVDGFHVCENMCLDILHDIFEGCAKDAMLKICNDLIYDKKFFSLDFLNGRLQSISQDIKFDSNRVPPIQKEHLTGKKRKLKMSAAEFNLFLRYFGLAVGQLVPEESKPWELYILLRRIVDIALSPRLTKGHVIRLKGLVQEFLSLYRELYGDLIYKFHNLTHLPSDMQRNGPAVLYSTIRYESKHRFVKQSAIVSSNRVNVLKTIAIRCQLRLAFLSLQKTICNTDLLYESKTEIDIRDKMMYFPNITENIFSTNSVELKDILYEVNMVFVLEMNENDQLIFGKIAKIFIVKNEAILLMEPLYNIYFDDHLFGYKVQAGGKLQLKNVSDLIDIQPCTFIEKESLVIPKYVL